MPTTPVLRALSATDRADDATVRAVYDLARRAELVGREERPFWSYSELATAVQQSTAAERLDVIVAELDGEAGRQIVGAAFLWSFLADNTDKAGVQVDVDPGARRRGVGRALLDHAEGLARADGRAVMMLETVLPSTGREEHPHALFAAACGYRLANYEVLRDLSLPVPQGTIQEWVDLAAAAGDGYRVEVFVDAVPDDLVPSLCVLLGQLVVDAPTGEIDFEEMDYTPERYRENVEMLRAGGRIRYEALALTADDVVVAQSTLAVPIEPDAEVYQWGTFVHREHRGHRLGLAVKAANLDALQRDRPDLSLVVTRNAETNDHMVAINEQVGFEPVEVFAEFVKRL